MAASDAVSPGGQPKDAGSLPRWNLADMPEPLPYSPKNALRIAGSGAIILGVSIGSGEWLIGPAATAQYTAALLWVATMSILLQWVFNEEACRYTLYTGEPITVGFMRTKPGPKFWGWYYVIASFMNNGWPGWAAAAATAIVAAFIGGVPGPEHAGQVLFWGYMTFFASLVLFLFGSRISKTLEMAEWFMILWILLFLVAVGLIFVPASVWATVFLGFIGGGTFYIRNPSTGDLMGLIPQGADWLVIGGFAAYAGAGGVSNLAITNWVRDKGMGMAAHVGYIPAVVGGRRVDLAATGSVCEPTPENVRRFRVWFKYIRFDQLWVWVVGCFLGMGLPALLTVQFIPPGTQIGGMAVAVRQAEGLASGLGGLSTIGGTILWYLTLLTGFWILFSTQLGIMDFIPRSLTDLLWTSNPRIRQMAGGDVRKVYYTILVVFVLWGCVAINLAQPLILILIGAFAAGAIMSVASIHVWYVNRTFLPKEFQPPLWRQVMLFVMCGFFGFFTIATILSRVFGINL